MFPLGLVLMPGMVLPLRLFEDRYLQMYAEIVDDDREFGVVLIERGVESRDDNPTFEVGCIARMLGSGLNDDGTVAVVSVGTTRIRVDEWLESSPYPRARVTEIQDGPLTESGMQDLDSAADRLPDLLAKAAELNPEVDPSAPELSEEPVLAIYQLAQLAGLQALDLQKVLEAGSTDEMASLVNGFVSDTIELIELQLSAR